MASNTLLTDVKILRKSLMVLQNNLAFIRGVRRQYAKEFAIAGAKIGQTVNIRKPNQFYVRKGDTMQVQGVNETYVPLTLATKWGVDISFNTTELTLDIDDFSDRYITPAMARLAAQIDQDCLQAACSGSYVSNNGALATTNAPVYSVVGTPGTTPGTTGGSATGLLQYNAPQVFLNAGAVLDNHATPNDKTRTCLLSPLAMATSVNGLSGLFNDQKTIGDQYRDGYLGYALGFDYVMDQNVYTFNVPTSLAGGTPVATVTDGSNSIPLTVLGSATGTIPAGTIFTVGTVYEVNPVNQQSTGLLQQFVVTTAAPISGNAATVTVYPTPVVAASQVANGTVTGFTSGGTSGSQTVVFLSGTAVGNYQQSLAYHPDAFTFATADLEVPSGLDFAARDVYEGISMRIVRQYSIGNDTLPCRIDVLGGFTTLRPELAVRLTS